MLASIIASLCVLDKHNIEFSEDRNQKLGMTKGKVRPYRS